MGGEEAVLRYVRITKELLMMMDYCRYLLFTQLVSSIGMLRLDFFSDGWLVSWMGSNRTMISGEGRTSHQKIEIVDWLLHDVVFLGIRNLLTFHFMSQLKHFEYEVPKNFFQAKRSTHR